MRKLSHLHIIHTPHYVSGIIFHNHRLVKVEIMHLRLAPYPSLHRHVVEYL